MAVISPFALPNGIYMFIVIMCMLLVIASIYSSTRHTEAFKKSNLFHGGFGNTFIPECFGSSDACHTLVSQFPPTHGTNTIYLPHATELTLPMGVALRTTNDSIQLVDKRTDELAITITRDSTIIGARNGLDGPVTPYTLSVAYQSFPQPVTGSVWKWTSSYKISPSLVTFEAYHARSTHVRVVGIYNVPVDDLNSGTVVVFYNGNVIFNAEYATLEDITTAVSVTVLGDSYYQHITRRSGTVPLCQPISTLGGVDNTARPALMLLLYNVHLGNTCAKFTSRITMLMQSNECTRVPNTPDIVLLSVFDKHNTQVQLLTYTSFEVCVQHHAESDAISTVELGVGCHSMVHTYEFHISMHI